MIKADKLRERYLSFFESPPRNHKRIFFGSLVPENDPTTLFTSCGMQPLVPYLLGEKHPLGTRLVNSQPCLRTQDIEEVGDNRHTTFFEMLGNWSLGDYFKKEQLSWLFEFLTKAIGLSSDKLFVSVFEGNKQVGKDEESIKIWRELFKTKEDVRDGEKGFLKKAKIYTYGLTENWWSRSGVPDNMPAGEPGGATSEIFYDFGADLKIHENSPFSEKPCHLTCDCGRFLEIGNSVFMEYRKNGKNGLERLPKKNVDFGGGFERILAAVNHQPDIFKTELFWPIIKEIEKSSGQKYQGNEIEMQVIADHLKAVTFMAQVGLRPTNKAQGYMMRRLIRRAVVKMIKLGITPSEVIPKICCKVVEIYGDLYFDKKGEELQLIITSDVGSFLKTLDKGTKLLQAQPVNGKLLFDFYQAYGVPLEISLELLDQWGKKIGEKEIREFERLKKEHQKKSRSASRGMFKGGLADSSEKIVKLHTVTHLLHQALRDVLGNHVRQVGSNITAERLRFDFIHPGKLDKEQLSRIEKIVNEKISQALPVKMEIMNLEKAKKKGALALFDQKYGEKVKVYSIGSYSREACGGPHVENTDQISHIKIKKEKSIGASERRIYIVFV